MFYKLLFQLKIEYTSNQFNYLIEQFKIQYNYFSV